MTEAQFAEISLLGPRGELLKTVKAQISSVVLSRDPIEVEPHPAGWKRYEPARYTQWSFHLMEDTKREKETRFCGDRKSHGFHRFADRFWCDGHNAMEQAIKYMVKQVEDALAAENTPQEIITRIRNRLVFGHPEPMGGWISQEKIAEAYAKDLMDEKSMKKMVAELMGEEEPPSEG